jgi:hypothetical protein
MGTQKALPQLWPTGPAPGVYVTTSQAAINALVASYQEATDGAVLFAESAASSAEGSIDLGENGLWSSGLDRVPSGTLIVVGPLDLVQNEWERNVERLQMACDHADLSGHRVAVLARTPAPADVCEDIYVMAKPVASEDFEYQIVLRGVVTETGELVERVPFARPWPSVSTALTIATPEAIPATARRLLVEALQGRKSGLLVFGGEAVNGHWAADLVDAALALTEHAGPAARIIPRWRSTASKDWQVPEATRQLAFLPSIQSAYDRGYRRMVIDPHQIEGRVLKNIAGEVLFIAGTHGYEASTILFSGIRGFGSAEDEMELLTQVIGLVGVARLPTKGGVRSIADLFMGPRTYPPEARRMKDIAEYVDQHRALRWEDEAQRLLNTGELTIDELKSADIRPSMFARFCEQTGLLTTESSTTA